REGRRGLVRGVLDDAGRVSMVNATQGSLIGSAVAGLRLRPPGRYSDGTWAAARKVMEMLADKAAESSGDSVAHLAGKNAIAAALREFIQSDDEELRRVAALTLTTRYGDTVSEADYLALLRSPLP